MSDPDQVADPVEATPRTRGSERRRPPRSRRRRRHPRRSPVRRALLLVAGLLLVLALVSLFQAVNAYRHLDAASALIPDLRAQVTEGDLRRAGTTAEAFQEHARSARDSVHGPHWSMFAALPGAGPNVEAVQTVTTSVDDLAMKALPRLLAAAEVIDPATFAPRNGRIDLEPIEASTPDVLAAHEAIAAVDADLAVLDPGALAGPLQAPVRELVQTVGEVASSTATAAKAVELIPPMLGADGPRDYLLLSQNNAEPRALGGITGAVIRIRANDGRIRLAEQQSSRFFGQFEDPVVRLSPVERDLFGDQLGRFMQNVTATPHFPRSAEIAGEIWRARTGQRVDGVAAVDPVALQQLLGSSGAVRLPTGQRIDGSNAAQLLLNQVYLDLEDPAAQDAFFAVAAAAIFEKVMSGGGDLPATTRALAQATDQGRVLLWSAQRQEQAQLSGTPVAGELEGARGRSPVLGVYVNDRTGAKMGYYQHVEVETEPVECNPDGSRLVEATVTVASRTPRNIRRLPDYVTGGGAFVPVGDVRSEVYLYASRGGIITDFRSSDGDDTVITQFHRNLHVGARDVTLGPDESVTLRYQVRLSPALPGDLEVRLTPGPQDGQFGRLTLQCP